MALVPCLVLCANAILASLLPRACLCAVIRLPYPSLCGLGRGPAALRPVENPKKSLPSHPRSARFFLLSSDGARGAGHSQLILVGPGISGRSTAYTSTGPVLGGAIFRPRPGAASGSGATWACVPAQVWYQRYFLGGSRRKIKKTEGSKMITDALSRQRWANSFSL